jgi:uncharacterized protein (TIGR00255 family)
MISSMTGYAREQSESEWGILTWEVRSVNHRYLETSFRLPEQFRYLEIKWRQLVNKLLSRGKLDLTLKFTPGQDAVADFELNQVLLEKLSGYSKQLADFFPNTQTQVSNILNWPGVIKSKEKNMEVIGKAATDALKQAIEKLQDVRGREGAGLLEFFEKNLNEMQDYTAQIKTALPGIVTAANQKIKGRFDELQLEIDQSRLEQELTWLAQKVDVAEELKRLSLHIDEFGQTLEKGGVMGRRLDFLAQELNREANTLASKSIDASVTHLAVELKVLIEQIREQVQNIE